MPSQPVTRASPHDFRLGKHFDVSLQRGVHASKAPFSCTPPCVAFPSSLPGHLLQEAFPFYPSRASGSFFWALIASRHICNSTDSHTRIITNISCVSNQTRHPYKTCFQIEPHIDYRQRTKPMPVTSSRGRSPVCLGVPLSALASTVPVS